MKKIDMHCHLHSKEYVEEVNRRNLFYDHNLPEWESAEARISDMDRYEIEQQVLSPTSPFVYFKDEELNIYLSQSTNDLIVDICHRYPDRFSGFINVPLNNTKLAIDEIRRIINKPGILGIAIGSRIMEKPLHSQDFKPFFEEVDKLGIPIMIHPVSPVGMGDVKDYHDFYRSVGFLWETTIAVGRMAISGIFERYQKIKWILSHSGGALPFVYTSMEICQQRNPDNEYVPQKPLSEYFRRLYVDTARLMTMPIFSCALELYGEDHIMFGTDIPYAYDVTSQNILRLENFDISADLKRKVFYDNAKKLLKI